MIFEESKNAVVLDSGVLGWIYRTEDLFGVITIQAIRKLEGRELDDIVAYVLRGGAAKGEILMQNEEKKDVSVGTFTFEKNNQWLKDDENNP